VTIETLFILALATWYVSYVLTSSEGPHGIFRWIREHVWHGRTRKVWPEASEGEDIRTIFHDGLLDCPICLSFWVALILVTVTIGHVDIVQTLAVAGLAMLAHGMTGWRYQND
jgi:hypothetical protein